MFINRKQSVFTNYPINQSINRNHKFSEQNREHNLAVGISTDNKTLSYRLDSVTEHICEITDDVNLEAAEIVVTLGDGGNSMIGCVTLVTVEIDGETPPYEVITLASNEVDECTDDDNECAQRDCNKKIALEEPLVNLTLSSLLFGGSPTTNGARELGITACLKNIYVDYYDIIYMLYDEDKRVQSSMELSPCKGYHSFPDLFAIGSSMFSPDVLPNEFLDSLPVSSNPDPENVVEQEAENKDPHVEPALNNFVALYARGLVLKLSRFMDSPRALCSLMLMVLARCTVLLQSVEMARSSRLPDRADNKFCTIAIELPLVKCNCDSRAITFDSGYLYGEDAGITRVIALHSEGDVNGRLTIGPLECKGFAGDGPIRFSKPKALPIGDWRGEPLSLQFRTAVASAIVFSVQDGSDVVLSAELINGKLNDTKWHLLVLEIVSDEVRLGVDSYNGFAEIATNVSGGELLLNGDTGGFIGCIRSVAINDNVIDIQHAAKEVDGTAELLTNTLNRIGLYLNCDDRCNSNFCQNSGECIEDFASDGVLCRCKYSNVQSGRNCEIDINQNSSVSFNGGFLKYELLRNPLVDQTVISFRTDQSHALILFVHDHHNNFMQIELICKGTVQLHLSEEVNLTLSLNNEAIVTSCTVRARPGTEFSNMEWIQLNQCMFWITIEHSTQLSTLTVDDDACSIHAARKLSEKPVQKFSNVFTDIVIIPVGLNSPADPKPFLYTFVGGVERESHSTANLLGCVRGLKVGGEVIDLRHTVHGYRPSDFKAIRSGCDMGCDTLNCKNGGHCSVAWHEGEEVSCDCSRTSYAGPECTIDEGLLLTASSYFLFDMERVLSRFILIPQKRVTQTMQFAFAPTSPSTNHQQLASVVFNDERLFEVILNKNGSINVAIIDENKRAAVRTFVGNFSDGYRHFFVAHFGKHQATVVTVFIYTDTQGSARFANIFISEILAKDQVYRT
uniref:EGF-like domain-containing protein n=1 Tax=Angiostrongylus cantonensis TaxID=6313 RepID=A0A158PBQ7_ANGCA